jgi:polar amino acid transport system substrate-binding protein
VSPVSAGYYNHTHPDHTVSVLPAEDAQPELAWNVAVGLRRPDDAMREAIDAALDRLTDDGTIAQIYGRYGVSVQRPR